MQVVFRSSDGPKQRKPSAKQVFEQEVLQMVARKMAKDRIRAQRDYSERAARIEELERELNIKPNHNLKIIK